MCSTWDLDQELDSYNENVFSSDIKIKISLSVPPITICPFDEKGQIAEKDERNKEELKKRERTQTDGYFTWCESEWLAWNGSKF